MRLQNTIKYPIVAVGLLLLTVCAIGAWYVLQMQRLNSQALDLSVSSIRAAGEMEMAIREMRHNIDRYLVSGDRRLLEDVLDKESSVKAWLNTAIALSLPANQQDILSEIGISLDEFFRQLHAAMMNLEEDSSEKTLEDLVDSVLTARVLDRADKFLELNDRDLKDTSRKSNTMSDRIALALLLLGLSAGILGFAVGYGVARRIRRSMVQLSEPIRAAVDALESTATSGEVSAQINFKDLEAMLHKVTNKAGEVVEQLRERQHEVIRADQMAAVGQLAAGLAHELRNPLMSIKILVQSAVRRGGGSLLDASDLKVLNEEVTRLENLLQEFMDFARPATLQKSEFDLVEVVSQTVGFLKGRAQRRNVTMECRLPDHIKVEGDAAQIRQVLLNLLLNALDAVSNGGFIWVDASCANNAVPDDSHAGQEDGNVYLRVSDNGAGLPENERDRICEPFFSTKETGLGLGLAISSRIIHGHGGDITAADREGGGAVFTVKLPLGDKTATFLDTSISINS